MNGIDKIIEKINNDAENECKKAADDASEKSRQIISDALAQADKECAEIIAEAEKSAESIKASAVSKGAYGEKQELLRVKTQLIEETINLALTKLRSLAPEEYFETLVKLVSRYSQKGSCEMLMGKMNSECVPGDFASICAAAASKNACTLTLSDETAPVADGFILKYGDIEINCSFAALISEKREELKEKVNSILF